MPEARSRMKYDLSHLTQEPDQKVMGPIQDDEALLLYALCRVMLIRNVVEVGVQTGYSAGNFLSAIGGNIIGIDKSGSGFSHPRFSLLCKNAADVKPEEIPWPIDLVFFDCHDEEAQKRFFRTMEDAGKITPHTIIAIHDTNLHPGGVRHQPAERQFSNWLLSLGWSAFHAHTRDELHSGDLPFRHGLTLLCRNPRLP